MVQNRFYTFKLGSARCKYSLPRRQRGERLYYYYWDKVHILNLLTEEVQMCIAASRGQC